MLRFNHAVFAALQALSKKAYDACLSLSSFGNAVAAIRGLAADLFGLCVRSVLKIPGAQSSLTSILALWRQDERLQTVADKQKFSIFARRAHSSGLLSAPMLS